MVDKFLVDECDQVKDETLNNGADVDFWGSPGVSESNQQVFGNHGSVSGLQEGDEVVRNKPTSACGNFICTKEGHKVIDA